jgi:hypothetical protein
MKLSWLREEEKLIPCKIVHLGGVRELMLHHLSAADIDEADRKFTIVRPPVLMGDDEKPMRDEHGMPRMDEQNLVYVTAAIERAVNHASYLSVMALGADKFDAKDIDDQIKELRNTFSRMAIIAIRDAALADAVLTPAILEAAKESVVPFDGTSTG